MADIKLIEAMTNAFGPSGFEEDVVAVIKKNATEFDVSSDSMNNVYVALKSNTGKKPILMLDAHTDEVGFMVQYIDAKGLVAFVNVGGWVTTNIPAHTVKVKNSKGELVKGILTSKPPHFMTDAERAAPLDLEKIYIDVGATSREEVIEDFGIAVGDPIMPDVEFSYNKKNGVIFGKAFDNRLGCVCILETLKALAKCKDLPVDVVGSFAAQEEVGTRGAQVTAQTVKPDLAIVFEGSPSDDMYMDQYATQCALKKGAQIRHMDASHVSNADYMRFAKELASKEKIPYQSAVRRRGGTNAGKISLSHIAVPVLVLGAPSRYVHTHFNYAAIEDIDACVSLAVSVAKNMDSAAINRIYKR